MGTGTGVETPRWTQDGNREGRGDRAGKGTGTEVVTLRRTQDGSRDGNGGGDT